ncbi:MAG: hypothetical protein ACK4TA_21285 [Saprospiraceae bacterium]
MTQQTLYQNLHALTDSLLDLARQYCWNTIAPKVRYIIRKVDTAKIEGMDLWQRKQWENRILKNSPILSLEQAVKVLHQDWNNIYLIELYIFHAKKKETLVEIEVLEKSELEETYQETLINHIPTFHCKINMPLYLPFNSTERFDINWHLKNLDFHWRMFWFKRKMRKYFKQRTKT